MPDTTDVGAEESTVHVLSEEPVQMPTEEQIEDAQAAAQLATLFINYKKLKRSRPKFPAESKVMPIIGLNDDVADEQIASLVSETVDAFFTWTQECRALLLSIRGVGESNPGANVHLVGRDGRAMQTNGTKLFEALLRTEAQILGGNLANG